MFETVALRPGIDLRLLRQGDAPSLAAAYIRNREHLAPWEPTRSDEFFTEEWQAVDLEARLRASERGDGHPLGLYDDSTLIGRFNLGPVVRGAFQSAGLGYWVDSGCGGRGLATAAVREILRFARADLGLHRVEASTLLHNVASQHVLLGNGFRRIGMAPQYLQIAGRWQDHLLYQVILHP